MPHNHIYDEYGLCFECDKKETDVEDMLENKIILALKENGALSSWGIANAIYSGCMNKPNRSNGARVASIRKACRQSKKIMQFGEYYDCVKK